MPRCIGNLLLNLSLLFSTILLFFGGIEVLLRVSGLVKMQDYTPPIYARNENPEISYTLKPSIREKAFRNWVTTDVNGFRITQTSQPPKPLNPQTSKPLLVILGDSITFGYGVADDETFPAELQKFLPNTTVINAGVPGYHIGQEVALYEEKLAKLDPDVLILIFFWNDDDTRTSWLDEDGVLRGEGWQPSEKPCQPIEHGILALIPGKCWLDLHSAFYRAVKEYVNTREAISERDQLREEVKKEPQPDATDANDFTAYEASLQRLARIAPAKRIFVIWPDATFHEIERSILADIAIQQGFAVIDLYDHFGNTMETLSWDYIHPSAGSLAKAATVIEGILHPLLQ